MSYCLCTNLLVLIHVSPTSEMASAGAGMLSIKMTHAIHSYILMSLPLSPPSFMVGSHTVPSRVDSGDCALNVRICICKRFSVATSVTGQHEKQNTTPQHTVVHAVQPGKSSACKGLPPDTCACRSASITCVVQPHVHNYCV